MDIKTYLRELELTDKEAEVYLACLEIGETNLVPIAKRVSLPRNTVAYILEKLRTKSLIDIIERNKRHLYVPKPPRMLLTLLRSQQAKLEERIGSLQTSLPELNRIYASHPFQPQIKVYRGREEIRELYEEMLESPVDEIWYVGEYDKIIEVLGERYLKSWINRRIKRNILTKSIRVRSAENRDPIYQSSLETRRAIRYAPLDFKSPGHVNIYGDSVAIVTSSKEDFGVVVISREYVEIMKNWFKQLWKVSEEK